MRVLKLSADGAGCNSYLITKGDGGNEGIIIDCASSEIFEICKQINIVPVAVLLTHGHFDHVGGCGTFYEHGVPLYCGEKEKEFIHSPENKGIFGGVYIPEFEIAKTLTDGESITLGGVNFKVISTPGHTAGSVCYLAENCLFTGDTLFCEGVGRSDLPTGDFPQLSKA